MTFSRVMAFTATLSALATVSAGAQGSGTGGGGTAAGAQPPAVFTESQAKKGQETYEALCLECHINTPHYGPPFAANWNGRTAYDLFATTATTMPQSDPGSLTTEDYVALVAYMLKINGYPAGKDPLPADSAGLQRVKIEVKKGSRP
jgi:cytochrome c5